MTINSPHNDAIAANARPDGHRAIPRERVGILLVNLGTPDAATPAAVKRYLREFLSDERIVDLPRALWLPILHGVILNVRPAATAKNYAKIWRTESNESPLRYFTRTQAEKLATRMGDEIIVDWAMRYGSPSIRDQITAMKEQGVTRLVVAPLYPQYSATTTASVTDAVFAALADMRWQPALRIAPPFHDDPAYIAALAEVTRVHIAALGWQPERVLLSYHGLPERYLLAGDPYYCHCAKTSRLLRAQMGWSEDFAPLVFQSKFGREKWLEPATEATLKELGAQGVKRVAVITPAFVSDCIETLEEIAITGREVFLEAGGEALAAIPCLNDKDPMIDLLETLMRRESAGWI